MTPRFETYSARDGLRWRFIASNNRTIADSGQGYNSTLVMRAGIRSCKTPGAVRYEAFPSKGQWYWNGKASNFRILVDGAEGYWNRLDCERACMIFQHEAPLAPVMRRTA